jgi:hypothetical protein
VIEASGDVLGAPETERRVPGGMRVETPVAAAVGVAGVMEITTTWLHTVAFAP